MKKTMLVNKKLLFILFSFTLALVILFGRIIYIQVFLAEDLRARAYEQQTRDRLISPNRGGILDRNYTMLATTQTVASISVIHNQIEDKELVIRTLSEKLEMDYETVSEKVNRRVALERIKTKVDLEIANEIRDLQIKGIVVDEDIERVYPYSTLAAQVIGFVGRDNQGIIGLEAKYDEFLRGTQGRILTETDVRGRELEAGQRFRIPPVDGYDLVTSLDVVVQQYAEQIISAAVQDRNAKRGAIIVMNPQNGEIYAMANYPDFDLNEPFAINDPELELIWDSFNNEEQMNHLNQMWRNFSINDTFEPGSTFKILTAAIGMEEGHLTMDSQFTCNGYHTVGGRQIRCWRFPRNHGTVDFLEGIKVSCNPVFMMIGEWVGAEIFHRYMEVFKLNQKTGIDLPGEAKGIIHALDNIGSVELATISFGQGFQITPLRLMTTVSTIVNGGFEITPHVGTRVINEEKEVIKELSLPQGERIISQETSRLLAGALEQVVYDGTGNKAYIPGMRIGGKTATSEKLPRRSGKYIASFVSFAPAENPSVMAFVLVDEPQGMYYGGQVAGPIMHELLDNILEYLGVMPEYNEEEINMAEIPVLIEVPNLIGRSTNEASLLLAELGLTIRSMGAGENIIAQLPIAGEQINKGQEIIIYLN